MELRADRRRLRAAGAAVVLAIVVGACAWGEADSASEDDPTVQDGAGLRDDDAGRDDSTVIAVGSPVTVPDILRARGAELGFVLDRLAAWDPPEDCGVDPCLVFVLDPPDAVDECIYDGSEHDGSELQPGDEVPPGSTVILRARCDALHDPELDEESDAASRGQ